MVLPTEISILGILAGSVALVVLFTLGTQIKNSLGDTIYNTIVYILAMFSIFGIGSAFALLGLIFGEMWLFNYGELSFLVIFFLMILVKVMRWA